jgi:hypothetical protein
VFLLAESSYLVAIGIIDLLAPKLAVVTLDQVRYSAHVIPETKGNISPCAQIFTAPHFWLV